jgi:hypothetical protein
MSLTGQAKFTDMLAALRLRRRYWAMATPRAAR